MKKVILLFLFLLFTGNICYAQTAIVEESQPAEEEQIFAQPVVDISKLSTMEFDLTEKQKNQIHKIVFKTNEKIEKIQNKIDKTKQKILKVQSTMPEQDCKCSKSNSKKLAIIKELNEKLSLYQAEILNVSRENKAKITKILTQSQNNSLNSSVNSNNLSNS